MSWMLTHTARHVDYLDPRPEDIHILDIAAGLSCESRYNGQSRGFYSVAQHSWLASQLVPREHALEALLHDATEAYMKDLPRPLKELLPEYRVIEARLDRVIRSRFQLPPQPTEVVKRADMILLSTERRDLMVADATPWSCIEHIEPLARKITAMQPSRAQSIFLKRYLELTESHEGSAL